MTPSASVAAGTLLAGKYRTVREIGRGGMGVVLEARHEVLDTRVAIKVLAIEALQVEGSASRFLREARAAAGLRGEYVARVTDFGTLADGRPFMVMEFLEGEDLAASLARGLPREEAIDSILQACAGLAEAHAAGIVHRDLKPSNLFRARRPDGSLCTKVVDFGISKLARPDHLADATTKSTTLLGTPYYMSPEQVRSSKSVDARTDVWQMGVVLYQALTGSRPFDAENIGALFAQILELQPTPPRQLVADLSPDLEAVVMAALTKAPADRISTISELAERLAPYAGAEGRVAAQRARAMGPAPMERTALATGQGEVAPGVVSAPASFQKAVSSETAAPLSRTLGASRAAPSTSRTAVIGAVIGLGLLGAASLAYLIAGRGPSPAGAPAPSLGPAAAALPIPSRLAGPPEVAPTEAAASDPVPAASASVGGSRPPVPSAFGARPPARPLRSTTVAPRSQPPLATPEQPTLN